MKKIPLACFQDSDKLKSVSLPRGLKSIGERAFNGCGSLEKLRIPDNVSYIGKDAFDNCNSLTTLVLPKKLKSYKADFVKTRALTKVANHSKLWIPLDTCKGKRVWKVGGKKVTKLAPGKTATTAGVKYKLIYYYSGGKPKGKMPKYYYYGKAPKLPKGSKKGYTFLGWFQVKDRINIQEKFPSKCGENVYLTAVLIKLNVRRISDTKAKITISDKIRWNALKTHDYGENVVSQQYTVRVFTKRPTKEYDQDEVDLEQADYWEVGEDGSVVIDELDPNQQYYYEISFRWFSTDGDDYWSQGMYPGWYHYSKTPNFKK